MDHTYPFSKEELLAFIDKAAKSTYAAGNPPEKDSERPGFIEFAFEEGDFSYRDSYTGYYRSRGMEVVRYKGKPVWVSMYGGGTTDENPELTHDRFEFLKKALSNKNGNPELFRGADLKDGDWVHTYKQEGDVFEFSGYEEILYKGRLVFFHRIIGGTVIDR